jgi:hypothetical protein
MDPYLEEPDLWQDVHAGMIVEIRTALNAVLPDGYLARVDRYVWLREPETFRGVRLGKPDVFMTEEGERAAAASGGGEIAVREQGRRYVRILDRQNRRVVTVIELLSPSNKTPGRDQTKSLAKREEYLATGTNLVEIDLLRDGERPPLGQVLPEGTDYDLLVSRAVEFPRLAIWPFTVRDAIPVCVVPLRPEDGVVRIDLKACLDRCYDNGRYGREIDYSQPPPSPLREADAAWARELLAARPHPNPGPTP